jgi:TRAP-type C4-dicarboxylate transport system permease small subunit
MQGTTDPSIDRIQRFSTFKWIDRLSVAFGRLGDVLLVAIACMLTYEVVARYVFLAPTEWTQDVAVTLQLWFTFLGMALVLRQRQMIRISAFLAIAGPRTRYVLEGLALVVIGAFALVALVKGYDMMMDSIALGRRQPTMLALPNWIAEVPIVVGFALLFLQSLADLIRLPFGPPPTFSAGGEHDLDVSEKPSQKAAP